MLWRKRYIKGNVFISKTELDKPRTVSSLSADLIAAAVQAASQFVLLIECCGNQPADIFIRGANAAFQTITGYGMVELQDCPLTTLVAARAVPTELLAALHAGMAERTEMLCQRRDGHPLWIGLHLVPMPQAGTNYFIMIGRDITIRHRKEMQSQAVSGLLAKVFSAVKIGVLIVDDNGVIILANPYIHRLLRMQIESLIGRKVRDFILGTDLPRLTEALERQLVEGGDYTVAVTMINTGGTEIMVSIAASVIVLENLPQCRLLTINPADYAVTKPPTSHIQIVGKVQLIGLEEIKSALGTEWPAHAKRAIETAEQVINKRCGQRDTFVRTGDASFMVRFADGTEEEAAFRAAMIAHEIRQRLIGDGKSEETSHVIAVTASVKIQKPEQQAAATQDIMLADELTRRAVDLKDAARTYLVQTENWQESIFFEPVHTRPAEPPVAKIFRFVPQVKRRIVIALATLPKAEAEIFNIDALMVKLATTELARQPAEAKLIPLLIDVRYEELASNARANRYLAAYQHVDPRLRQAITLILTDIPPNIYGNRLIECAMRLREYCGGIGFQADAKMTLPFFDMSFSRDAFARAVIVVLPAEVNGPPGGVLPALRRLIPTIHACRHRLLVHGLENWGAAEPLLAAGVDMVSLTGAGEQRNRKSV